MDTAKSYGTGRVGSRPTQQPLQQTVQQPLRQPDQQPLQQHVQRLERQPLQQPIQQPPQQSAPLPMQQPVYQPSHQIKPELNKKQFQPKHRELVPPPEFEQYEIQPVPAPQQIVNGVPFKLPSIQERLKKNRVYFDGKTAEQAANEKSN